LWNAALARKAAMTPNCFSGAVKAPSAGFSAAATEELDKKPVE